MFLLGGMLFMTSCETDPTDPGDPTKTPPLVTLAGTEITLEPGEAFVVGITAIPGDADLRSLGVYEDGVLVDPVRLEFNGVAASANPIILAAGDKGGFNDYDIVAVSHTDQSTRSYRYEVIDENNNSDSKTLTVTTFIEVMLVPPTFTYMGGATVTVDPGSLVALEFDAAVGSADLSTIEVYENGALITDVSRLFYGDLSTQFDANPYAIPAVDQQGFSMRKIYVRTPNAGGTFTYDLILSAADGETATGTIDVSTGTAITTTLEGVLLNSAGPAGTGGLDLDTGNGTGSSDSNSEIRDLGIDGGQTGSDWIRKIAGINNYEVRLVTPGQNGVPETFTFDNTNFKEAIVGAYDASPLNEWVTELGDLYVVSNGINYYLLNTIEINETETTGDNTDFYRFNVKF